MVVLDRGPQTPTGPLADAEREQLNQCEAVIERGLHSFVEVGKALAAILEQRLYRQQFQSFEQYCETRWDLRRAHAYRQMQAACVMDDLSPIGDNVPRPANEAQARPLTVLPNTEAVQAAWIRAVADAGGQCPTAKVVQAAVDAIRGEPKPEPVPEPEPAPAPDEKEPEPPQVINVSGDPAQMAQQMKRGLGADAAREVAFQILGGPAGAVRAFRKRYGVRETYAALRRQSNWDEKDRVSLRTGDLNELERIAQEQDVELRTLVEQIVEDWVARNTSEDADAADQGD